MRDTLKPDGRSRLNPFEKLDRELDVFLTVLSGATFKEAGERHGISRERARQLFYKLRRVCYNLHVRRGIEEGRYSERLRDELSATDDSLSKMRKNRNIWALVAENHWHTETRSLFQRGDAQTEIHERCERLKEEVDRLRREMYCHLVGEVQFIADGTVSAKLSRETVVALLPLLIGRGAVKGLEVNQDSLKYLAEMDDPQELMRLRNFGHKKACELERCLCELDLVHDDRWRNKLHGGQR